MGPISSALPGDGLDEADTDEKGERERDDDGEDIKREDGFAVGHDCSWMRLGGTGAIVRRVRKLNFAKWGVAALATTGSGHEVQERELAADRHVGKDSI